MNYAQNELCTVFERVNVYGITKLIFCLLMEDENIAFPGGYLYFAEHFGHKNYNHIWKMPSVLLAESLAVDLEGKIFIGYLIFLVYIYFSFIMCFLYYFRAGTMA